MSKKSTNFKVDIDQVIEDSWLNIVIDPSKIFNPLGFMPKEFEEEPHMYIVWLMSKPEYFSFFCSEILNIKLLPFQAVILCELWNRKFPMLIGSRGMGKSFLLAIYALMRIIFLPGRRVIICGAGFRQSKIIFQYMENIWKNAPLLRDMVGTQGNGPFHEPDMYTFRIGESTAVAIPIGTGEKIRGLRANDIIADEFSAINREIFETVIGGFGVVSQKPVDIIRNKAKKKIYNKMKVDTGTNLDAGFISNQIIFSGTAYYQFNHFYEYWKKWRTIIKSHGDIVKLEEIFSDGGVPDSFNWKDYSIIRIPYNILPDGLMDDGIISRAKATVNSGVFENEYGSVFSSDSNGFFKRSLIESCVPSDKNEIKLPSGQVDFEPMMIGNASKQYIIGVDPASEVDNFSIVVLEINKDHRKIVHVWTTTRKSHREALKTGLVSETDFYGYCASKIRDLMKRFPCAGIAMDSQGGGIAVSEALHDRNRLTLGELPIWPTIDPDKPKDTDGEAGLHILDMCNFASAEWTAEANHGLKKDFEDKICLFPRFDSASIGLAVLDDTYNSRKSTSLEDLIYEIEELKNELSIIVITKTDTGRDRWDTPEVKVAGNKKGRMRKDRYSALVMANMVARKMYLKPIITKDITLGGFATLGDKLDVSGPDYSGPSWFTEQMKGLY